MLGAFRRTVLPWGNLGNDTDIMLGRGGPENEQLTLCHL